MELGRLAEFLTDDEDAFTELLEQKTNADVLAEQKNLESELVAATARSNEILRLFEKLYEDNVSGKVTDDWFMRLSQKYEMEQDELKRKAKQIRDRLTELDRMKTNKDTFLHAIRKFMEMKTLTPMLLHELIEKIEVHQIEGTGKNRTQRIVIHYRFVGCIDIPSKPKRSHYTLASRKGVAVKYLPTAG